MPDSDHEGWLQIDDLGPCVDLLHEAGRTYAPFMLANAAALSSGADEVVCEIDGLEYRQGPFQVPGKSASPGSATTTTRSPQPTAPASTQSSPAPAAKPCSHPTSPSDQHARHHRGTHRKRTPQTAEAPPISLLRDLYATNSQVSRLPFLISPQRPRTAAGSMRIKCCAYCACLLVWLHDQPTNVLLDPALRAAAKRRAYERGLSVSAYIRELIRSDDAAAAARAGDITPLIGFLGTGAEPSDIATNKHEDAPTGFQRGPGSQVVNPTGPE